MLETKTVSYTFFKDMQDPRSTYKSAALDGSPDWEGQGTQKLEQLRTELGTGKNWTVRRWLSG